MLPIPKDSVYWLEPEADPWASILVPKHWAETKAHVHAEHQLPGSTLLDGKPVLVNDVLESQWIRAFRVTHTNLEHTTSFLAMVAYPGPRQFGITTMTEPVEIPLTSKLVTRGNLSQLVNVLVQQAVVRLCKRYLKWAIQRPLARCCKCTREAMWRIDRLGEVVRYCHKCWTMEKTTKYKHLAPFSLFNHQSAVWYVPDAGVDVAVIPEAKLSMWCGIYEKKQKSRQLGLLEGV